MSHKLTVLLDGDDTLWKTQEVYDEIKQRFVCLLESTGIQDKNIISKLDDLDAKRVAIKGFTKDRFLESMMIIYAQYSASYSLSWDINIEKEIFNFGDLLQKPPRLYEDTIQTLEALKSKAHMYLFSAGQKKVQLKKINTLGLSKYFEDLYIVKTKNRDVLENVITDVGVKPAQSWLVGNSLKSDVLPAVSAGLNTIFIDRGGWKYDHNVSIKKKNINYFRVHTLSDAAIKILGNIQP